MEPEQNAGAQISCRNFYPNEENIMNRIFLTALILTFSAGTAVAQQQGGPNAAPGANGMNNTNGNPGYSYALNRAERLTERLGLSDEQAAELALLFEDAEMLRDEVRERARLDNDAIRATIHERIQLMLTPEQQALFEEQLLEREQLRQALEELRAERGYGGMGGGNGMGTGRGTGDCINN